MAKEFFVILTDIGRAKLANAVALGQSITLTHMAVGDGGGESVTPDAVRTALVREVYRAQLNTLETDPDNPNYIVGELVIPSEVGGWTIREAGVIDSDGNLFAVGNLPASYKPKLDEGSAAELRVRLVMEVGSAASVTLKVDPTVVLASREYAERMATTAVTAHNRDSQAHPDIRQTLAKKAEQTDLAAHTGSKSNPHSVTAAQVGAVPKAGGSFDGGVDADTLRARHGLTVSGGYVTWNSYSSSHGEGDVRGYYSPKYGKLDLTARDTQGQTLPLDITLNGHKVWHHGNDGSGSGLDADTLDGHDASDFAWKASEVPVGAIIAVATATAPKHHLKCNGAAVGRTTYANLFAAIGTRFGAGDGSTTFNLPDLRGEFVRGWDDGRGVDAGRALGSAQGDEIKAHDHQQRIAFSGDSTSCARDGGHLPGAFGGTTSMTGGPETRPRNVALMYCIKY
ncbi:phage-related tail fiber protein [Desulfobaculum xiamenense]|uniref:Phage-related tail fiber protein n=1 Tax=Desulfobaculum xiamenense TaxID=995050 RepID=A0A846QFW6_9BACT|nr:phage tail protein [Desulfobaculum xiamenense]NJB67208.1 phage-related tail fiber protein [Desulfobaculum xiamenense]